MTTTIVYEKSTKPRYDELAKRQYMPGYVVKSTCTKCGNVCTNDMDHAYFSCPIVDEPFDTDMYCEPCDNEWYVDVVIRMSLELA